MPTKMVKEGMWPLESSSGLSPLATSVCPLTMTLHRGMEELFVLPQTC